MLEKKQESQRRGALPRLLLFTFLFAMPVYMCYQLQRGTLAQTLAVTKQASTIVKRVVKQKNDTARAAALMSLPTTFANETGDNRTGVELHASICGERSTRETCGDVIYVVDDRLPSSDNTTYIAAQWRALSHIVENFEVFNGTCIAFYDVKNSIRCGRGSRPPLRSSTTFPVRRTPFTWTRIASCRPLATRPRTCSKRWRSLTGTRARRLMSRQA